MMKTSFLFFLIILEINCAFACCGASKKRIFPLGSSEGKLVVASLDLSRKCDRGREMFEEYHWSGTLSLSYYNNDSLELISVLDTLDFHQTSERDSTLNNLIQFYDSVLPYYQLAIQKANQLKEFNPIELVSFSYGDDILHRDKVCIKNDTTLSVNNKLSDLFPVNFGACGYLNAINELRVYRFNNKKILIMSLSCEKLKMNEDDVIIFNSKNLQNKNAFTVNRVGWHGGIHDYIKVEEY